MTGEGLQGLGAITTPLPSVAAGNDYARIQGLPGALEDNSLAKAELTPGSGKSKQYG